MSDIEGEVSDIEDGVRDLDTETDGDGEGEENTQEEVDGEGEDLFGEGMVE